MTAVSSPPRRLSAAGVVIDLDGHSVQVGDQSPVALPAKELLLLWVLMEGAGRTVSHDELIGYVWRHRDGDASQTLATHIRRLRDHIEQDARRPTLIRSVRGVGYRFEVSAETVDATPDKQAQPEIDDNTIRVGPIEISLHRYVVTVDGRPIPQLPLSEFRFLAALARHAGTVVPYSDAATAVASKRRTSDSRRQIEALAAKLRQRLGIDAARLLRNIRGLGYVLDHSLVLPTPQRERRIGPSPSVSGVPGATLRHDVEARRGSA